MDSIQEVNKWQYKIALPFDSERICHIVHNSLRIDTEPRQHEITRELLPNGNVLQCHWKSTSDKTLRVALNAFFENVDLILKTVENFDPQYIQDE